MRYQVSIPGASALNPSTTLAQNRIGDGAVLVLSTPSVPLPAPRYVDIAREVAATLRGPLGCVAVPQPGGSPGSAERLRPSS